MTVCFAHLILFWQRTINAAKKHIQTVLKRHYQRYGYGLWAIECSKTGIVMGMCGLLNRPNMALTELGYAISENYQRQGVAYKAASLSLELAKQQGIKTLAAITSPNNQPSQVLLVKLGFNPLGERHIKGIKGNSRYFECAL